MSSLRSSVEHASLPVITRMARLPKAIPFLVMLALLVAGILIPGWGWVLMAVGALVLAWILFLSWPGLGSSERLMRVAVLALWIAITVTRARPR
ncbi:MAG: DUF6703 family protein [Nostocoides sp.]